MDVGFISDIKPDMAGTTEENQVTRLKLGTGNGTPHRNLRVGCSRQRNTEMPVNILNESTAIKP